MNKKAYNEFNPFPAIIFAEENMDLSDFIETSAITRHDEIVIKALGVEYWAWYTIQEMLFMADLYFEDWEILLMQPNRGI